VSLRAALLAGAALLAAAALPACAETETPAPVVGVWQLATVNGQPLPAVLGEQEVDGQLVTVAIASGVLDIGTRRYTYLVSFDGYVGGDPVPLPNLIEEGSYDYRAGTVTFSRASGGSWSAAYADERLTVTEAEGVAVFVRTPQLQARTRPPPRP
jgi:hypothetical protein